MNPRRTLSLAAALAVVALVPSAALARQSLHGKWAATLTADADAKEHADVVEFTAGDQLTSEQMKKDGFEPAGYSGRGSPIGSAEQFEATLTNKAGDTAKWQGQVLGGQLTGTLTVTRKDGSTTSYSFKATRK